MSFLRKRALGYKTTCTKVIVLCTFPPAEVAEIATEFYLERKTPIDIFILAYAEKSNKSSLKGLDTSLDDCLGVSEYSSIVRDSRDAFARVNGVIEYISLTALNTKLVERVQTTIFSLEMLVSFTPSLCATSTKTTQSAPTTLDGIPSPLTASGGSSCTPEGPPSPLTRLTASYPVAHEEKEKCFRFRVKSNCRKCFISWTFYDNWGQEYQG